MAKVQLPFDDDMVVRDLPFVCMLCGAPAVERSEVTFFRDGLEPTVHVPICDRHPLQPLLWPLFGCGMVLAVLSLGLAALLRELFPPGSFVPVLFTFSLVFAVVVYAQFTEMHVGRVDGRGLVLWNVSRHFAKAWKEYRREKKKLARGEGALLPSAVPVAIPVADTIPARRRKSRKRPRGTAPLNHAALWRSITILAAMALSVFGLLLLL
jgi:hypothetical protein